jgi:predicted acetyltransferase
VGTLELGVVELRPLTDDYRPVVERLWQLYSHDMSEFRGTLPNEEGEFKAGRLPGYLDDPANTAAFLLTNDGNPAGFAFVTDLTGARTMMGDFFVARAARGKGLAFDLATDLIRRYPGEWEIGFQGENHGASKLWRRVAEEVAPGAWREERRPVLGKPHIPDDHFVVFRV